MIVCVCNAIDEDELRAAARAGAPCPRSAYAHLGCELQCGTCLCFAQEIIDKQRKALLQVESRAA
ncbi:MAG: (2Fe-2S)-binding protein [Pseudomonadota bacterium]|nr:(2Fe-2S)-binding protein [Sphingomonas sp.]MDQ3471225.1 (2Fe-2S)-binding protein [Pseudomonadota bacterium]